MQEREQLTATVKSTAWSFWQQGAGDTVLLLHGSDGAESWRPIQAALANRYRVILPIHPGFDGTSRPDWLDSIADLAQGYAELIDRQGWGPVHLVGYDLGGWIAAEMAVRCSHRLRSLTLISAQGLHVPDETPPDTFLMTDEQLLRETICDTAMLEAILANATPPEQAEDMIRNKEMSARLTWQPRGYDLNLQKWLHRVKAPTQILWGQQDRILSPAFGTAWCGAIPGAACCTLASCGHAPHREQPESLEKLLHSFMANVGSVV